jgi:uncharacterized protein YecT (DUF1311 family)
MVLYLFGNILCYLFDFYTLPLNMKLAMSLILFVASSACLAAEPTLTPKYDTCMDSSGGVTSEMLDCIGAETERQDTALNANFKKAMQATPKSRQTKLRDAQRNWIKFRDADCDFYNNPDGGTMAAVDSASCVMTTTAERAESLRSLAVMLSAR